MVAGQLIEEVTGQTWEQFVRDRVLGQLGMNHRTDSDPEPANPEPRRRMPA